MDAWLRHNGSARGAVVSFDQTWALAQRWYAGRVSPAWRGRNGEERQAIMDEVGLTGEFWRLL